MFPSKLAGKELSRSNIAAIIWVLIVLIGLSEFVTHRNQTFKVIISWWDRACLNTSDCLVHREWPYDAMGATCTIFPIDCTGNEQRGPRES